MNLSNKLALLLLCFTILLGCENLVQQPSIAVIPEPAEHEIQDGFFTLNRSTEILIEPNNADMQHIGAYLSGLLEPATWYNIQVDKQSPGDTTINSIRLTLDSDTARYENSEAYTLSVNPDWIEIKAPTPNGLFYGVQTLRQLFPPEIELDDPTLVSNDIEWTIPAVEITDFPRYPYRGMHLDVGRHFFPVEFIKKYLDLMALHKMNRFHWHLTEDQGWRIEIKKYPKLTRVGAWRDSTLVGSHGSGIYDRERYGGFYTQEEIREVVAYARDRYITVIPEIEMPGHSSAALAAYPQFGCVEGKDYQVKTSWGIKEDIYCPGEATFTFLENVLTEVMELFPGKYIHIGGDEAPKKQWEESELAQQVIEREGLANEHELQSYFIRRIEKFLNSHGRQIIGWDEILEGGLAPNATVMSWRGIEGGIKAAKQHHNVIMTPTSHVYLDYYQADPETEPLAIGGFTTLEKTYSFEPTPGELTEEEARYILGAQANVWTEYIKSGDKVEYMAYPRASALAEVVWSPKDKRNWTNFWHRMQTHFERLDMMDVNYAGHYEGKMPSF